MGHKNVKKIKEQQLKNCEFPIVDSFFKKLLQTTSDILPSQSSETSFITSEL